jgi:hypothetical protein
MYVCMRCIYVVCMCLSSRFVLVCVHGRRHPTPPRQCQYVFTLVAKAMQQIENKKFFSALRNMDQLRRLHLPRFQDFEFSRHIEDQLPVMVVRIQQCVKDEFENWLASIKARAKKLGVLALSMMDTQLKVSKPERERRKKRAEATRGLGAEATRGLGAERGAQRLCAERSALCLCAKKNMSSCVCMCMCMCMLVRRVLRFSLLVSTVRVCLVYWRCDVHTNRKRMDTDAYRSKTRRSVLGAGSGRRPACWRPSMTPRAPLPPPKARAGRTPTTTTTPAQGAAAAAAVAAAARTGCGTRPVCLKRAK